MIRPNGSPLNIYNLFHENIGQFVPMTMQYNSISLQESKSLLSLIHWMNNNLKKDHLLLEVNISGAGWS